MTAIDFMTRFEEDGLHLYELLAYNTTNPELRTTYGLLANGQRRHIAELLALKQSTAGQVGDSVFVDRAKPLINGFSRLLECHDIHAEMKNDPDAFWHVVNAEQEFIRLMEGMAHAEPADANRQLLQRLVDEEKEHLEKIENIYDFIKTPHTYLEWGEFSNLHPL